LLYALLEFAALITVDKIVFKIFKGFVVWQRFFGFWILNLHVGY